MLIDGRVIVEKISELIKTKFSKKMIFILEIIAVLLSVALIVVKSQEPLDTVDFAMLPSDNVVLDDGVWVASPQTSGDECILRGCIFPLKGGHYTLYLNYKADSNQRCRMYADQGEDGLVEGGTFTLDKNKREETFDFYLEDDIVNLEFRILYNYQGEFKLKDAKVTESRVGLYKNFVLMLAFFAIINLAVYCKESKSGRDRVVTSLLITFASSLPLLYYGINEGHDLVFHLMRIEGLANEIKAGHIPSRMQSVWMTDYGYPVSIYYGDILLYLPALLRICGFSINEAYKAFVFIVNFATAYFGYVCFGTIFKDRKLAAVMSLVYSTAAYRMVDVYTRSAVGEYCALMFFPVIVLAVYKLYSNDNTGLKNNVSIGLLLALGMTGIVTAHVLSAEMTAFILALVFIVMIKKSFRINQIRTWIIGTVTTCVLSAYFLVPFLDYYINTNVRVQNLNIEYTSKIQGNGASIGDLFAVFKNFVWMQLSPGLALMSVLMLSIFLLIIKRKMSDITKKILFLSAIMLWMSSNFFPWDILSNRFAFMNLLAQIQFPWRWIGIANMLLTLLLGHLVLDNGRFTEIENKSYDIVKIPALMALVMILFFQSQYGDNAARTFFYDTNNLNTYDFMGGEYLRASVVSDRSYKVVDTTKFSGQIEGDFKKSKITGRTGTEMDFYIKNDKSETTVTLPVINYPGYVVYDESDNEYPIRDGENLLITFDVPASFDGDLYLRYVEPTSWRIAEIVSLIAFLASGIYGFRCIRKLKEQQPIAD